MNKDYQATISEIFHRLETNLAGLSDREAFLRLSRYDLNQLKEVKKTKLFLLFLKQFEDLFLVILAVAAVIALFVGEPRDTMIILAIIFINAIIGFSQEYKAEKILSAFKKHLPSFSKVLRGGTVKKVLNLQLVPGDILILETGDAIGADARLLESYDLETNDFSLTGESAPQTKKVYQISQDKVLSDIDNMVFMGTTIVGGNGKAVIVKTGMETAIGQIAQQSQTIKEEKTPLQKELIHTGKTIAKIALCIAVFVLIALRLLGHPLNDSLLFAVVAGLAMVPEGLPAAVSVALSLGAQRMLKKNALVKKLLHVESLGSTTVICTDKTGTLTTGELSVAEVKIFSKLREAEESLENIALLCNQAEIGEHSIGDPLEVALLKYYQTKKINYREIREENNKIDEVPFDSLRKMMTILYQKERRFFSYTKGACLEILEKSNLEEKEKNVILETNNDFAKKGLRVIAFGCRDFGKSKPDKRELETNLDFIGLVAFQDPPREGVKEAIKLCRQAKIRAIMITGDYELTALSIAQQIGMADDQTQVVTGEELHKMDDNKLKEICKQDIIFARVEPGQKLRIVQSLQDNGEIVAVTGDGVNDVPALVKGNIGVAMGKIGTDVAKEAADMILLDDNFATIVLAIREGRRIFDNAKKFVYYVLSSNSGELFTPFLGIILGLPLPLIAIQILAIDLGTDLFPSLALGVENEEENIMKRPPRPLDERILGVKMLSKLFRVGAIMGVLGIGIYLISLYEGGWHWRDWLSSDNHLYWRATASVYATLILCQAANAFSCRSQRNSIFQIGWLSNRWLLVAELISAVMLWALMSIGVLNNAFRMESPSFLAWTLVFASFFIFLAIEEVVKKIQRLRG